MAFHRNTLLLVALLPASIQLACAEMAVPAGFEDLAKTQRLWIEVNLYGESLGLLKRISHLNRSVLSHPKPWSRLSNVSLMTLLPSLPPCLQLSPFHLPVTATWRAAAMAPQRDVITLIPIVRPLSMMRITRALVCFWTRNFCLNRPQKTSGISLRRALRMR